MILLYLLYHQLVNMPILQVNNQWKLKDAYDLILVSTDHAEYKTFDFSGYACPLVDSRNCIQHKA